MTLGELRQEVYDHFGMNDPSPEVVRRVDGYLNTEHQRLVGRPSMNRLRRMILPITTTANSPYVVLPLVATKLSTLVNRTTNKPLYAQSLTDLRRRDAGNADSTGDPTHYTLLGYQEALAVYPSAASELFVKSSSSDDKGVTVIVNGVLTGGVPRRVTQSTNATNGTTAVSLDATLTTFVGATGFSLQSPAKGDITLHEGSGSGTELARIPKGRTASRYTRLQLYPYPTAAVTLYADVEVAVLKMVDAGDEPLLPVNFHWLLSSAAIMREWSRRKEPTAYAEERARHKAGVSALALELVQMGDLSPSKHPVGWSQLGAMFPAGT